MLKTILGCGWKLPVQIAVIVGAACWIFQPALHGQWLWDDNVDVVQNPVLQSPSGLWQIWFEPGSLIDYYPVKSTVQWLQWHFWSTDTLGYHLTNLVLHIVAALLFWRVLAKLGLRHAWLGALIFTIHPAQVESVAWIAELKNTLATPLFLLSALFYLAFDETRRARDYALALVFFLLAMLTKPVMVMFPVVLLFHAWWKRGRVTGRDAWTCAPFFLISLAIGLLTLAMEGWYGRSHHVFTPDIPVHGILARVALAGMSLGFYIWTVLLPVDLSPLYPQWPVDPPSVVEFLPGLALAVLIAWLWIQRRRGLLFGLGFFVLMLAPFVGPVSANYMNFTWVMDHFLYIPIMGLIGLAVAAVEVAERNISPSLRYTGTGLIAALVLLLAWGSRDYARTFAYEGSLWSRVVEHDPGAWIGHNNLGNVLVLKGRFGEAEQQYQQALLIKPNSAESECNYGIDLLTMGQPDEAIIHFQRAAQFDSGYPELHTNWGVALARLNRPAEAIAQFQEALKLRPDYGEAYYNLAEVLFNEGRYPEAAARFAQAAQLNPHLAEAQHNWGLALARMGQLADSLGHYREAVRLKPDYAEAQADLAEALLETGQTAEALEHYPDAVRLNPGDAKLRGNWGLALTQAGRPAEAIPHYQEALQIKPGDFKIHNNWGNALAQEGQFDAAIRQFQEALRLKSDYAEAHNNLAITLAEAGRQPEAVAEFQKAIQLNPNYAAAHDNLGITLRAMGRKPEAQAQFEAVLRLNPGDVTATNNLQLLQQAPKPTPASR